MSSAVESRERQSCYDGFYTGQWNEGDERHGTGRFEADDGTVYEGGWQNNKRHGQGKLTTALNTTFEGTWRNDSLPEGKCIYPSGNVYEGSFMASSQRHGEGRTTLANGDTFAGRWSCGKPTEGTYTRTDGGVWTGTCTSGHPTFDEMRALAPTVRAPE
jgi:hypothetical protein